MDLITQDLKMINIEGEAAKIDYSVAQNLLEAYCSLLSSFSSSDTPEKAEYVQEVAQ